MVQIMLTLKVLFTQDSEVEDQFCGEPSLFFSNNLLSLEFEPDQDDFAPNHYTPALKKWGVYWFTSVRHSVRPSFRNTFSSKISPQPCKLEESYLVYRLMMTCCIVGLQTSLLLLILPCICPIFFLSIL